MKRFLSLFTAVVMLLSVFCSAGTAYSASKMYAEDKLAQIQKTEGFIPGRTAVVTGNCYAFVSKVCEKMYGTKYDGEGLYGNYKSHHYSGNYKTVATFETAKREPTSDIIDKIKDFFVNYARPGDVIHFGPLTDSESNNKTHTVMVNSINSTRLQVYHANYETVDYSSTDCHIDSIYWSDWKKNPTNNTYTASGTQYSGNRIFYNTMKVNGLGITINRYVDYDDLYYPVTVTIPTVTTNRISTTGIVAKWDKIRSATRYKVSYRSENEKKYTLLTSYARGTSYNVTGLKTGTRYYFKVCALVNGNWRDYSDPVSMKALPPKLSVLNSEERTNGLYLSWKAYSDLTGITVYRSDSKNGKYKEIKTIKTKSASGFTDTTVKYGKKYYYKVKRYVVKRGKTYSTTSEPISATYKLSAPKIKIYRYTTTSLRFCLTGDGAQTAFTYTLKDSSGRVKKEGSTVKKELIISGLKLGETYTMKCAEKNKFGTSAYTSATKQQLPPSSSDVSASPTSSGVLVSYKTAPDVDGYYIYRSTDKDSGYEKVGTVSSADISTFLDTGVKLDTTYYYKTKRYVVKGGKTYISSLSSKGTDAIRLHLDSPSGFTVARSSPTSMKVLWDEVNMATSYIVYYRVSGGNWRATQPTANTSVKVTGLTTGKNYIFKVYARNRIGAGEPSIQKTVRALPKVITGVTAAQKDDCIRVYWPEQSGVSGYIVYRAKSSDGEYVKIRTITTRNTNAFRDKNVKKGRRYYYKVCSYKTVGSKDYCGNLSKAVSVQYK